MLGSFRFLLAFLVLLSHLPGFGMSLNWGVVSVICFYFMSGFLMRKSYTRFINNSNKPVLTFYLDRAIKLFPLYLIVCLLTFLSLWLFGRSEIIDLLNQEVSVLKIILHVFLLPINYVFEPLAIQALMPHPVIPPAWSLATEFHFYLLLPLIFTLNKKSWLVLLFITMLIQFTSFFFSSGDFNSDSFGYRYIFGVLTIFLYGFAYANWSEPFYKRCSVFIWGVCVFFVLVFGPILGLLSNPNVSEVLVGGILCLPLVHFLKSVKLSKMLKAWDHKLGDLAYPMFISHTLAFYGIEKLIVLPTESKLAFYFYSIVFCLFLSYVLSLIQIKIEIFRMNQRGFKSLKTQSVHH